MRLAHCPGHGIMKRGTLDSGCVHNGIVESIVTMDIAKEMTRRVLVPMGYHALLRDGGTGVDYGERALLANREHVDLVICHHINAASSPSAHGLIVFYSHDDEVGREVAEMIERAAPYPLIRPGNDDDIAASRGDWTRRANWVMSHYRRYGIPAVLIEWGFSTNVDDAKYLLSEKSRPAMAACVVAGVARFTEIKGA
jgi:N-acetylmuramoyl-L-alanine amidase